MNKPGLETGKSHESSRFRIPVVSGRMAVRAYFDTASQQLLVGHKQIAEAYGRVTEVAKLLAQPMARELLSNDGSVSYLMHSTSVERAQQIMVDGLRLERNRDRPDAPNLVHTVKLMPAWTEPGARKRIEHGITYRYGSGGKNAKLVFRFDEPNPGNSLRREQFVGTKLEAVDDQRITETGLQTHPYRISADTVVGYFDLDNGDFVSATQNTE